MAAALYGSPLTSSSVSVSMIVIVPDSVLTSYKR